MLETRTLLVLLVPVLATFAVAAAIARADSSWSPVASPSPTDDRNHQLGISDLVLGRGN